MTKKEISLPQKVENPIGDGLGQQEGSPAVKTQSNTELLSDEQKRAMQNAHRDGLKMWLRMAEEMGLRVTVNLAMTEFQVTDWIDDCGAVGGNQLMACSYAPGCEHDCPIYGDGLPDELRND